MENFGNYQEEKETSIDPIDISEEDKQLLERLHITFSYVENRGERSLLLENANTWFEYETELFNYPEYFRHATFKQIPEMQYFKPGSNNTIGFNQFGGTATELNLNRYDKIDISDQPDEFGRYTISLYTISLTEKHGTTSYEYIYPGGDKQGKAIYGETALRQKEKYYETICTGESSAIKSLLFSDKQFFYYVWANFMDDDLFHGNSVTNFKKGIHEIIHTNYPDLITSNFAEENNILIGMEKNEPILLIQRSGVNNTGTQQISIDANGKITKIG